MRYPDNLFTSYSQVILDYFSEDRLLFTRCKETKYPCYIRLLVKGTQQLSEMSKGSTIQVLGPLGNTFDIGDTIEQAIIVGGGAGIASLMLLAVALRERGIPTIALVGSQNRRRLLSVDDLRTISVNVHIATDDGSVGHHGFVTDILTRYVK